MIAPIDYENESVYYDPENNLFVVMSLNISFALMARMCIRIKLNDGQLEYLGDL